MPLTIKRSGQRPVSVGGLTVAWKTYDTNPRGTEALVQLVAHAPELRLIVRRMVDGLTNERDLEAARVLLSRITEWPPKPATSNL